MGKRFSLQFNDRGIGKVTDKVLLENIDTGVVEYLTADKLLDILGLKGQVKFPAVQVPSANVNTLDDYEEGTWTPILKFGGASVGITYSVQSGRYTKIGNLVYVEISMALTSKGISNGIVSITGLPYSITLTTAVAISISNVSFDDMINGVADVATTSILLREITNVGVRTSMDDTNFANNSTVNINATYRTV